jgi:glucose/arabinose dehydrogenase
MPRREFRIALVALVVLLIGTISFAAAQPADVALGDDPRIAEAGIELSIFAEGLEFPMGMVELPDGSLLVATSTPDGGSFFQSTGSLIRFTDHDADGRADNAGTVLVSGIDGPLVALQRAGDLIFVTSARAGSEAISAFRRGERWRDPLTSVGQAAFTFNGGEHQSYALAVRHSPESPGSYDLFFNLGAYGNLENGYEIGVDGLFTGQLDDASIYMTTVTDDGESVAFTEPVKIASGLRNATTLVIDPITGDLVIGENGIDTPENRIVSLSADEIDVIPADRIGGEVEDFGFPTTYVDYATGETVGDLGIDPVVAFPPTDGSENEGVAGIAPVPATFPEPFAGGYIAGFHGQFDSAGGFNEENPLLFADLETGERFALISNDNPGIGHLDSMLAVEDAIYVADLCATGSLQAASPCGVIYRMTANPKL